MVSVMVDARHMSREPTGVGRYCYEAVAAMQAQDPSIDWRFVLRRRGDEGALGSSRTVTFNALPYGLRTSLMLTAWIGKRPADIFHSAFHVVPLGLRCATVMTMHDAMNRWQRQMSNYWFPLNWLEWIYYHSAIPLSLRRAQRVICVSKATADALVAWIPSVRDKIRVIHHGVGSQFKKIDESQVAAARARLVGDGDYILTLGSISPNKNQERLLAAYAAAFADGGPKLVRVSRFGSGDYVRKKAQQLGVADRVVSLVSPSDEDLVALLNGALGLAFCSIEEGFGLPILEAMACGCPVLTSNVSCMPEIAGDAGLFADPLDIEDMAKAMRNLAGDAALRADLSARGLERVPHFSWERSAELHREVYAEALGAV